MSPTSSTIDATLAAAAEQLSSEAPDTTPPEETAAPTPETAAPPPVPKPAAEPTRPPEAKDAAPEPEKKTEDLPTARLRAAMERDAKSRAREEAVKAKEERYSRWEAAQKRWEEHGDPDGLFEAAGTTFDSVARKKLGGKEEPKPEEKAAPTKDPELVAAMERIKALEEQNAKGQEYVQRANLRSHLQQMGDEFELVNAAQRWDAVFDTLRDTSWPEDTTLDQAIKLAAKQEEDRLEKEQVKPLLTTKKVRSMMDALSKPAVQGGPPAKSGVIPKPLTNAQAGDLPPNGAPKGRFNIDAILEEAKQMLG